MEGRVRLKRWGIALTGLVVACSAASSDATPGEVLEVTIPAGASFDIVADTLVARELVRYPRLFGLFARVRGNDREIRSGQYRVTRGTRWVPLLDQLVEGRVITLSLTIPEGFTIEQVAQRLAAWTGDEAADVAARLSAEPNAERWGIPGPGLEGYLFPDTYRFAPGVSLDAIVSVMVERYRSLWTERWQARADSLGMTELLDAVVDLLHDATGDSNGVEGEHAQHHHAHVTNTGVRHQSLPVALGHRHKRTVHDADNAERHHPRHSRTGRLWQDRKRKPDESIGAHLQEHRSQND